MAAILLYESEEYTECTDLELGKGKAWLNCGIFGGNRFDLDIDRDTKAVTLHQTYHLSFINIGVHVQST